MATTQWVIIDRDRLSNQVEKSDPSIEVFDLDWTYTDSNELEDAGITPEWVDSEISRMESAGVPEHVLEQVREFRKIFD